MKTIPQLASVIACSFFFVEAASGAVTYQTVALTGQQAPGLPTGRLWRTTGNFGEPMLNQAGQVAFSGVTTNNVGDPVSTGSTGGIWAGLPGALKLAALHGNYAAPGSPYSFLSFSSPTFNNSGQVAFRATISGPGVSHTTPANSSTIWAGAPGALQLVARENSAAPGAGGATYYTFYSEPYLSPGGRITFRATIQGTGVTSSNREALFSGTLGAVTVLARTGAAATGATGTTFYGFGDPRINASGTAAFLANLAGATVSYNNGVGIWVGRPGALVLAARGGNQAAGLPAGQLWTSVDAADLNDNGEIAFLGQVQGPGVTSLGTYGLWAGKPGALKVVAQGDTLPPGVESTARFGQFLKAPIINAGGQVAFTASLTGIYPAGTGEGIWAGAPGALRLIARIGKQAPGTPTGTTFSSITSFMMNSLGQVVFSAGLAGTTVQGSNNGGIWATSDNGAVVLIARKGNSFAVPGFNSRTISGTDQFLPNPGGSQDGRSFNLNDARQLAFYLTFTDGTMGIFRATIPYTPPIPNGTDFNLDKKTDYLLFNPQTLASTVWRLNGPTYLSQATGPTAAAGWTMNGASDFNRDGKADVLLYNPTTRQTQQKMLNGAATLSTTNGPTVPAGSTLVGTADFNGDTKPDYLLKHTTTGKLSVSHLDGAALLNTVAGPTLPAGYEVQAIRDFNANNRPDLLLYNASTGQSLIWYMNDAAFVSSAVGPTTPAGWNVEGAADFNANGTPDFVLKEPATGATGIWYMNGANYVSGAGAPTLPTGFTLVSP